MKLEFMLSGLNCPNCAAKIEADVRKLPEVKDASLNLMKQTLALEVSREEAVFEKVEQIVHRYEPDVKVRLKNEVQEENFDIKGMLIRMAVGAAVFAVGLAAGRFRLWLLIAAYGILGYDVVGSAVRNLVKGHVFDENFLMSLSSIGAFCIGEYPEAVAVMLFYQVGEFFQDLAVHRSRKSISQLMDIRPDTATVKRNGTLLTVSPEDVAEGEWIVVKPGEKIPLDGVVLLGDSMVDTRALTGESVPRSVHPMDEVLSGCVNETGMLTIRVTKPYGESTVSKIIDMVENAASRKAPTENFITSFARVYTPAVVILAALLAVLPPMLFGAPWAEWIRRAFVFLVVSCPCALVLSVPLTFFGGIGAASRHGILVKGSNYLEALNKVDTVVFDKTGTLTKGVFKVTQILPAEGITGEQVLESAALAEQFSTHPIAASILAAYGKPLFGGLSAYQEIPGHGLEVKSTTGTILVGNTKLMERNRIPFVPCDGVGTKVYVAVDHMYWGCILIADEVKADSKAAMAALRKAGVQKLIMLTGDNESVGKAVAEELGLDECYTQLLPHEKVAAVETLDKAKRSGRKLAFVGDGINDAPVLARADIGIAMGGLGSDAAIEAADVVLMTDEPMKLAEAMQLAGQTRKIVMQNIVFALGIKAVFLLLGAMGMVGMWLAVFADVGVALLAVLNAMRILKK
ncbi:MAG: cadmium-translocating P-type ATPase [Oscillospiraceae bacterium]|nr:cadmium-translocating P-type ATPase [Oscillospiraceae bacterium]